jgi:IMP dehydrogenase
VPQLTAILDSAEEASKSGTPVPSPRRRLRTSGAVAKALAAGASTVDDRISAGGYRGSAGETFLYQGRSYKKLPRHGIGRREWRAARPDRYYQQDIKAPAEARARGDRRGQVPYKGHERDVIHQLVGGVKAAKGYTPDRPRSMNSATGAVRAPTNAVFAKAMSMTSPSPAKRPNYPTSG